MPNKNHIAYIEENISFIRELILIIGSKQYNFDHYDFYFEFNRMGLKDITGLDIQHGEGVDYVLDICDSKDIFFNQFSNYYVLTMCLSKKSDIMLWIDWGQKTERPVKEEQIGKKTIIYYLQNKYFV